MAVTTITTEGIAAVVNAQGTGASGVVIATCGVYESGAQVKTLPVDGVELIAPSLIRVGIKDQSTDAYTAEKLNFYLDDASATLFATITEISQAKSADSILMTLLEVDVSAAGSSPVTPSGTITMSPPVSTTEIKGIIETATTEESTAGTDTTRAVTPAGMRGHGDARYLQSVTPTPASSATVSGTIETATTEESTTGTDTTRAVTPAGMRGHGDARYSLIAHNHDTVYIKLINAPDAVHIDVKNTGNTSSTETALSWATAVHPASNFNTNDTLIVKFKNRYSRGTGNGSAMWTDNYTAAFTLVSASWYFIAVTSSGGWG